MMEGGWKYYPYGEKQNKVDMLELVEARILELLAAIFMGNKRLCKRAPDRLYTSIAKYMGSDHAQMHEGASRRRFMRVYQVLASSGDVNVCHKVAKYLVEGLPGHTTSPLHVEQIPDKELEDKELKDKELEDKDKLISIYLSILEDREDERIYQKNLISILAYCCAPEGTWTAYKQTKDGNFGGDESVHVVMFVATSLDSLKTIIGLINTKQTILLLWQKMEAKQS